MIIRFLRHLPAKIAATINQLTLSTSGVALISRRGGVWRWGQ